MIWDIILIIALVAANGFFVAAEFALVKVRQSEIETLAQEGSRLGQITDHVLKRLDAYLSACQLGITLASLGLGWYGEVQVAGMLEPVALSFGLPPESAHFVALPIAFGIITFLHITVGEQVPKMLAIQKSRPTALSVSIPLLGFYKIFRPFIWLLNASSNFMLRSVGVPLVSEQGETTTETELRLMFMNAAAGGHVTRRELSLMENVLDLEDKPARRYMTSRQDIVYLNRYDSMEQKLRIAVESGHTRFPLCEEDLDHILGIVHVKDMFHAMHTQSEFTQLDELARDPLFLPETIKLDVLLVEFQRRQTVIAILVDEYGVVSGMITLENVIEQVVGPIQDEFDSEKPPLIRKGVHRYEAEASCPVERVIDAIDFEIPGDINADTMAGVIIGVMGHIPQQGEEVVVGHHRLTVLEAEPRRVLRLLIEQVSEKETDEK
ncbi:MAG: hemolysin family protein [Gemmatimonadota bacterium]|nr:hemolysin family protein [Gemmatimonadota bacterium]